MVMNNIFSFRRFALLVKAYFAENRKRQLRILILVPSAILVIMLLNFLSVIANSQFDSSSGEIYAGNSTEKFVTLAFVMLLVFAGVFFRKFSDKNATLFSLSTPATALERTAVAFLYSMILFPLLYLISFFIINSITLYAFKATFNINMEMFKLSVFSFNEYFGFFTLISVMVFCSIYFKRFGVIGIILIAIYFIFQMMMCKWLAPEGTIFWGEFYDFVLVDETTHQSITINGFMYYFKFLLLPVLWGLTALRIKEMEV